MSTLPLIPPKFRAFDSNGDPLSGGKLYSYAAGTSTLQDTYTTRAGNIANANPVILDANGEADVWTTPDVLYKFVLTNAAGVTQWTVDNYPSGAGDSTSGGGSSSADAVTVTPGGRLTLTSGTPVTTADVTGATTVLYVPHTHSKVPLYDGTSWALYSVATELSQALSDTTKSPTAAADNSTYDLFVWNDASTLRVSRGPAWTGDNTRGTGTGTTELERVDGRYVNRRPISNGPGAQRGLYVGSIRVVSGAVADAVARRHVWNAYNRLPRPMRANDPAASWEYETDVWRQANGNAANQLAFLIGLPAEPVRAEVLAVAKWEVNALGLSDKIAQLRVGIGLDSSSVNSAGVSTAIEHIVFANGPDMDLGMTGLLTATYEGFPLIGHHSLVWLERAAMPGSVHITWYGQGGTPQANSGICGHVFG